MKIISGMHRSGTSLVARLFSEAGADFGDARTMYRPDKWNPDGYFEQRDILAINTPLIHGPWWKLAYFHLPSTETIQKRAHRRAGQIRQTAASYENKIVKETRFCLTLPAWVRHGANVEGIVVCLRDPIQVARSLQRRNRISLAHGYRLWLEHNRRLLDGAGKIPCWFLYYNRLLDKDQFACELNPALAFFGLERDEQELTRLQELCVESDRPFSREVEEDYSPEVRAVWEDVCRRHRAQFDKMAGHAGVRVP